MTPLLSNIIECRMRTADECVSYCSQSASISCFRIAEELLNYEQPTVSSKIFLTSDIKLCLYESHTKYLSSQMHGLVLFRWFLVIILTLWKFYIISVARQCPFWILTNKLFVFHIVWFSLLYKLRISTYLIIFSMILYYKFFIEKNILYFT